MDDGDGLVVDVGNIDHFSQINRLAVRVELPVAISSAFVMLESGTQFSVFFPYLQMSLAVLLQSFVSTKSVSAQLPPPTDQLSQFAGILSQLRFNFTTSLSFS